MRKSLIVMGMLAVATVSATVPATARPIAPAPIAVPAAADVQLVHHRHRHNVLPRRAIVRSLYHRGFRKVHNVHFRKGYWRARALGRRGVVALKIHPRSAKIVSRRVIKAYHHPRRHKGGGVTFSFRF